MRSLFWVFLWGLIYLSAYTEVTLATGSEKLSTFDSVKSTTFSSSKHTQTSSRFLRRDKVASTNTVIDVDNADNEERQANIGGGALEKLTGVAITVINAIYKVAAKIVGQANWEKFGAKVEELRLKLMYKAKVTPDEYMALAKKQPHPILKARHERSAAMYKDFFDLRKAKEKNHHS
ncbi:RxLR effector protein [Phytophthora megakarya]|uniref:RxLR effector protein n=1 Tax=Phytophthora megakarya TaxID=4795 RepID=A0A225WTJ7_9STRA|nr:RxLR effector protein [Phytophthora megakarya]